MIMADDHDGDDGFDDNYHRLPATNVAIQRLAKMHGSKSLSRSFTTHIPMW